MGRVQTLTDARAALAPREPDLDCSGLPKLDPRLCLIYQPHRSARPPADDPVRVLLASIRRVWPVLAERGGPREGLPVIGAPREGLPVVVARPLGPVVVAIRREGEALLWSAGADASTPPVLSWHKEPAPVTPQHGRATNRAATNPRGRQPWTPWYIDGPRPREGVALPVPGRLGEVLAPRPREGVALPVPGPLGGLLAPCPREGVAVVAAGSGAAGAAGVGCWLLGPPREGAGCWGPAQPGPLGLSEAQSPQNGPRRHGRGGLSANGARQIQRACAVLQDVRPCLAFWTVTLPDASIRELIARDLWPQFQTRIRDLLVRALTRRGLPARVVGVVELHPARSMRERLPLPHLHVVFQGRRHHREGWALSTEVLDRIIRDAVRYVGLDAPDVKAAGNVQPVRRNCGAYLSKYMSKNREGGWLKQVPGNLPRVWWFWSRELRAQVLDLVVPVCWSFVSWLHRLSPAGLERIGAERIRLELSDPRAPSTWCVRWRREDGLRRATVLWARAEGSLLLAGFRGP